jgi:hypothetical protein
LAGIDAFYGLNDVFAALFDVVVGADGHGLDLALRANNVLQGGAELDGEPPMGHENEADHP